MQQWYPPFIFVISVISCAEIENVSDVKYQLLHECPVSGGPDDSKALRDRLASRKRTFMEMKEGKKFLIDNIFDSEWKIGLYVDEKCKFSKKQIDEIEQSIKDGIRTWLEALGEKDASGTLRATGGSRKGEEIIYDESKFNIRKTSSDKENRYLFAVNIHCDTSSKIGDVTYPLRGSSEKMKVNLYSHPENEESSDVSKDSSPRKKHLTGKYEIQGTGIDRVVLLHEIGHLFGLDDTYYQKEIDSVIRHSINMKQLEPGDKKPYRNINPKTRVEQPESVMAGYEKGGGYNGFPGLFDDDKRGIKAMYLLEFGSRWRDYLPQGCLFPW